MKKAIFLTSILLFLSSIVFSQSNKEKDFPKVLQVSAPIYPPLAIDLQIEENIIARVKIDKEGKVSDIEFDRGDKNFHKVIKEVMEEWLFEKSKEKIRIADINFVFKLLPIKSKSFIASIFKTPNVVEIFAKKVEVKDN